MFVSDYDFETALMEALCRMASSELRKQLANRWFTMQHVSTAFVKIRDTEFETVKISVYLSTFIIKSNVALNVM